MKKTRVILNLKTNDGLTLPFEVEGYEALPGIFVHRCPWGVWEGEPLVYHQTRCQATHMQSGSHMGTLYNTAPTKLAKEVKRIMGGFDWTVTVAELLANPEQSKAARVAMGRG